MAACGLSRVRVQKQAGETCLEKKGANWFCHIQEIAFKRSRLSLLLPLVPA